MQIISVRDNENNRWKRNAKTKQKKKDRKKQGATEAVLKGWELSFVGILQLICEASLIFKLDLELAVSISR